MVVVAFSRYEVQVALKAAKSVTFDAIGDPLCHFDPPAYEEAELCLVNPLDVSCKLDDSRSLVVVHSSPHKEEGLDLISGHFLFSLKPVNVDFDVSKGRTVVVDAVVRVDDELPVRVLVELVMISDLVFKL